MHHIKKRSCFIDGPAGRQELLMAVPEQSKAISCIICHPHPVHGGTMHNKVVYTLASVMESLNIKNIRFNFRGVQQSEGSFDHGVGELQDLLNVVDWVKKQYPQDSIWLAGFSFGAFIALKGHALCQAQKLILVAPPVGQPYFETMPAITCPWLLVQGGEDEIIEAAKVTAWEKEQLLPSQLIYMPTASHFFHGQLIELKNRLLSELAVC